MKEITVRLPDEMVDNLEKGNLGPLTMTLYTIWQDCCDWEYLKYRKQLDYYETMCK